MPKQRRTFQRLLGERRYRKLFIIAVEGIKTEPHYFMMFNNCSLVLRVNCLKGGHRSSPLQVLKRMKEYLRQEDLQPSDEAWLVVDKDQWTDQQVTQLHAWAQERNNYGFALSNPKFEYWLLLHFEDGDGIASPQRGSERLKHYLPAYDKGIDIRKIARKMIDDAVRRARHRDSPPCTDWPRDLGGTTVYRLVERLLSAGE
jgi:hypothetical protein